MFLECFDFAGKAQALIAFHNGDDFSKFFLIPFIPLRSASVAPLFPVVHVEPLDVADAGWRGDLLFALHEDGLNITALRADGDGDLVEAYAGVAGGMFREEG